jgi:segregation and condensation protein A
MSDAKSAKARSRGDKAVAPKDPSAVVKGADEQASLPIELDSEARDDAYRISLPAFEGPLDLLLHLIQKHELDILDIPISFITEKYLEYLNLMKTLTIDVASEYLVMAATLAHIKSKMLLPAVPADQEDGLEEEEADPRAELVRRLLEYQKYKQAAADLSSRAVLGQDVFERGATEEPPQGPAPLAPVSLFALIDAFNRLASKKKIKVEHEVSFERISITDRINEIVDQLKSREHCTLEELLPDECTRADLVVTFLALLEMTRLKMTRIYQTDPLSPIHIQLALVREDADASGQEGPAPQS